MVISTKQNVNKPIRGRGTDSPSVNKERAAWRVAKVTMTADNNYESLVEHILISLVAQIIETG